MSEAMELLQERVGVAPDGSFGPNTARAITKHFNLSPERGAHLLGQAHHESGGFKRVKEGLYYSTAERIQAVWPSRFPTVESAEPYAKNPQKLANKVYNGRMGNSEGSNDGFAFAGKGFLQLTGKANVRAFANDMDLPEVLDNPDLLASKYAFETALWFFHKNGLFALADDGISDDVIKRITKRVNGGYHGLNDRVEQTRKIHGWLT
mgnify:CR=1 FL=1